ncbi:MAG: hypothetical protein V2A76_01255 [Planctomycetota bacterium]
MGGLLVGLVLLAFLEEARGQAATGKEATVPPPAAAPRKFRLNYEGASRYLIRDGDPAVEDAPVVLAVAGGAKLWFDDYFLTAQNILIWVDPESLSNGHGLAEPEESDDFPHKVSSPLEDRPELESAFAATSTLEGLPPNVTAGKVREVYAEGDVYITQGKNMIFQGDKAYFNVIENRSLIVNAEIRTNMSSLSLDPGQQQDEEKQQAENEKNRPAPIVIRAAEIRGVSEGLFEADRATVTTSTFAKPGYHIAMERLVYEERAAELGGKISGYGNEFILGDVSLLSLPYFTIRTGVQSPVPLIGLSTGFSSRFGLFLETRWGNVFDDLGNEFNQKMGVEGDFSGEWFADVNLYSARGLGLGGGVKYETRKKYFGKTEFFWINDMSGKDETSRNQDYAGPRGQFWTQNRIFLPDDWQFDAELNYVSDRGFLKEFKEHQYKEEKAPETVAYLKKLDGDTAVSGLVRYRLNTWQSQTEYLPQATYDVISRPIAEFENFGRALDQPEPVRLYWTHRSEVAYVNRLLSDDGNKGKRDAAGSAFRIDNIDRLNMPFEVDDFGFDPYFENRATVWVGDADRGGGGGFREGMTVGFNASTQYTRTDPDLESEFWNVHGMRHIVIPSLRYRWTFLSTMASNDLIPYDSVEHFDALHVLVPGITSRYQTKRMTRNGPETVTFLEFEFQQPLVFNNARENVDLLGDLHFQARWRPDLDEYLLRNSQFRTSADVNWNDGSLDTYRFEFRTEPGPDFYSRIAYSWAQRGQVSPTLALEGFAPRDRRKNDLSALTLEFGYQATRLWEFVVVQQFDMGGGGGGQSRLLLRRRTHDWMFEFGIGSGGSGIGTGLGVTVTPIAFFRRDERDRYQSALSDGYDLSPIFDEPEYATGSAFGSDQESDDRSQNR